jgi:alpha-tubulin suppressor-like RCC1 family protein
MIYTQYLTEFYIGGGYNLLAINQNGTSYLWGLNTYGELGDNTTVNKSIPIQLVRSFIQMRSGEKTTYGLDSNGWGWGWGYGIYGELGTNTGSNISTPKAMPSIHTFCKISAGKEYGAAIDNHGQGWSWGHWFSGNRGGNTVPTFGCSPQIIYGSHTFCKISIANRQGFAIDNHGQGWGWGYNTQGTLGNNTIISEHTPVSIFGAHTFCEIASGMYNNLAIDNHGICWGWGMAYIGNNTGYPSPHTPTAICGNHTICKIYVNNNVGSYIIDNHGQLWGWGYGNNGQIGNNSTANIKTPVSIHGTKKTFCEIGGFGRGYPIGGGAALDNHNNVWAWGYNTNGQLGDNTTTARYTPVRVCNI